MNIQDELFHDAFLKLEQENMEILLGNDLI